MFQSRFQRFLFGDANNTFGAKDEKYQMNLPKAEGDGETPIKFLFWGREGILAAFVRHIIRHELRIKDLEQRVYVDKSFGKKEEVKKETQ